MENRALATATIKNARCESTRGRIIAFVGGGDEGSQSGVANCTRRAIVAVEPAAACQRCAAGNGCGADFLQIVSRQRVVDVKLPIDSAFLVGDEVNLTIGTRALLRAAFLAYGLPLLALLTSLLVYTVFSSHGGDFQGVLFAVAGLSVGFLISRGFLARAATEARFAPSVGSPGNGHDR